MSSTRDMRSTQPNVTRSASRNSFVARSTVNNHVRLSRDDSPARRKSAKKLGKKLTQSSKLSLKVKAVKGPGASRDGSSESRRSTRSRDTSEDSSMSTSPSPSVRRPLTVSKKFPRKKSVLSLKRQVTREKGVSEYVTQSSKHERVSLIPKCFTSRNKKQKTRELIRGQKKRSATVPANFKDYTSESVEHHSSEMKWEKGTAELSYLRLSGRRRQSVSPSKNSSSDVNNEKREKTDVSAENHCKPKQAPSTDKYEQMEEPSIGGGVEYSSMFGLKARPTRKRVSVLSNTAEIHSHKDTDGSASVESTSLDKNANQSKVSLRSSSSQTDLFVCHSKISKKMQNILYSYRQFSPDMTDLKTSSKVHESVGSSASHRNECAKEMKSDVEFCEPEVMSAIKQSQMKRPSLGTTVHVEEPRTCEMTGTNLLNDHKEPSAEKGPLLEYEVKEKKSLSRELSNLTFSNPGRALAKSLNVSLEDSGRRMKRNVTKGSYFFRPSVEKPAKTKPKGQNLKFSRFRKWKEKQTGLKRKPIPQHNQPFKKQKIIEKILPISTTETTTSASSPVNVQAINNCNMVTNQPANSDQRQTVSRDIDSDFSPTILMKRKRGRPPKKRLAREKATSDTEVRESDSAVTKETVHRFHGQAASSCAVVSVHNMGDNDTGIGEIDLNTSAEETTCIDHDFTQSSTSAVGFTDSSNIIPNAEVINKKGIDIGFIHTGNSVESLTDIGITESGIIEAVTSENSFTECVETEASFTDSSTTQTPHLDEADTLFSNTGSVTQMMDPPASVSHATAQTNLVFPQKMPRKRRKRRTYKGCLDSSFKSKKKIPKQQFVNITLSQEKTLEIVTVVSKGQTAVTGQSVIKQSAAEAENPHVNFTVVEDNVHEEHSYAKNSPTQSLLYKTSAENVHSDNSESPEEIKNSPYVFDIQEDWSPQKSEQSVGSQDILYLQKPGTLTSDPNMQQKSSGNCVPSDEVPSAFLKSFTTPENVCVPLELGSVESECTDLSSGKNSEILMIDPIMNEVTEERKNDAIGISPQAVSAVEGCTMSVASTPQKCAAVMSDTPSVFSSMEKCIVATGSEVVPSGEFSETSQAFGNRPKWESSEHSDVKGKEDELIGPVSSPVSPQTYHDDSGSSDAVRNDGAKEENAKQGEKTTEAPENTSVLFQGSDINGRCAETTKPLIQSVNVTPSEVTESTTCIGRKTETDNGRKAPITASSLKGSDRLATDSVESGCGLVPPLTSHSTSPLSVVVDEWEDTDAPPQLTPVLNSSSQNDELSMELTSPPILLASDGCLTPMSDSGLLSSEEGPHALASEGSKTVLSQCRGEQTQGFETSTSSQGNCMYPTVTGATNVSEKSVVYDPENVSQTPDDLTELNKLDSTAESKHCGQLAIQNEVDEAIALGAAVTEKESTCVTVVETEITGGQPLLIPFKRPRGRPRKSKGRKFKAAKQTIFPPGSPKPKSKPREEKTASSATSDKPAVTVTRTFSLRPQVSRSPLENIALRFGGEEAYLSFRKKVKTSSAAPSQSSFSGRHSLQPYASMLEENVLKQQCKPCSVMLTDFVKQLNLESIDSSDDSDSCEFYESKEIDTTEDFICDAITEEPSSNTYTDTYRQYGSGAFAGFKKKQSSPASVLKEDNDQDLLATGILEMFANYKCKYCDYCSESSQLMEEHIYIHKEFFTAYPICCSNCPRRFTDQNSFRNHHIKQHPLDLQKCEVFETIDEKDHYQIVLRDGSTIDLKMTGMGGNQSLLLEEESMCKQSEFIQEDGFVPDSEFIYPQEQNSLKEQQSQTSTSHGHQCENEPELTHFSRDMEVKKVMQDILNEIEKCMNASLSPSLKKNDQALLSAVNVYGSNPEHQQESGRYGTQQDDNLDQHAEARGSPQVSSDNPSSPITILLSKDEIARPTDGLTEEVSVPEQPSAMDCQIAKAPHKQTEEDSLPEQSSSLNSQLEETSRRANDKSPDTFSETKAKVDPVVEKLRKIVRSKPPTIGPTSSTITQPPIPGESRMPSVLLQTEQAGKKESSVINTPSSTAPVIISVVVSGNVEVSTPDSNVQKQAPGTFICTYCTHGADDRSRMVDHVTQMHSDDTQYTCCICDNAFSSKMSVIHNHIKTYHPGQDQQKVCKPLPSFYALNELREHDSVRTKTSDNIFEMFTPVGDSSSPTYEKNEPLRQHFRKARDVMLFREKAKRQAEADSTTSGTGEDVVSNTVHMEKATSGPSLSSQGTQHSNSSKILRSETENTPSDTNKTIKEQEMMGQCTKDMFQENNQTEDDSCAVTSSEKSAFADSVAESEAAYSSRAQDDQKEDESNTEEVQPQEDNPAEEGISAEHSEGDTMLKIVSVVSLSGMEASPAKSESPKSFSNEDNDSGEITREAAQSAVSALFKKVIPTRTVITDTKCNKCEQTLDSVEDLYYHLQRVHKLTCFYSCPVCSQHMRKSEEGVRQHMLTVHSLSDDSIKLHIVCEKFEQTASSSTATGSEASSGIQCKHCAYRYSSAGSLLKHLESVHDEICLLVCPYCKKGISKEETEVYEHISTEHKTYDAFVPLLLVSNRAPAPPPSKILPKQSLTISESRRQLFASKTIKASNLPLLEKLTVDEEDTKVTQLTHTEKTSTSHETDAEKTFPSKIPAVVGSNSLAVLSTDTDLTSQPSEPQTDSRLISPALSPLAMLKKTTSSILNQAMSEAASALRPRDTTVNTYTTVFNVQPTPSVAKRVVPIRPKPDTQATTPVCLMKAPTQIAAVNQTGIPVTAQPIPLASQQEKPKPIIPRGIKHVEKRPMKEPDMQSQVAFVQRNAQTSSRYTSPSGQTDFQISHIPPFESVTAIATTVTRPLLRVPSVIPSAAGKSEHTRSASADASSTGHQQHQLNQPPFAANSPHTISPKSSHNSPAPPLPNEDAPLDLSRPVMTGENLETEEEVDPDAFNVFNLSPVKPTHSAGQPLNLSVKLSQTSETQKFPAGFRSQAYSQFSEARQTTISGARPANMTGAPPFLGTQHILNMRETIPTNTHGGSAAGIRMTPVGSQMVTRYPTVYRQQQPQMSPRTRVSPGAAQGNPSSGVPMMQRSYQPRPPVVPNLQRQFAPKSHPGVRHVIPGPSVSSETPGQELLTPRHAHKLVCPSCDFYTRSPAAMKAHITNVHKARYRCPYCPHLVPLTQRDVPYHIAQQHPDKKLMYFNI